MDHRQRSNSVPKAIAIGSTPESRCRFDRDRRSSAIRSAPSDQFSADLLAFVERRSTRRPSPTAPPSARCDSRATPKPLIAAWFAVATNKVLARTSANTSLRSRVVRTVTDVLAVIHRGERFPTRKTVQVEQPAMCTNMGAVRTPMWRGPPDVDHEALAEAPSRGGCTKRRGADAEDARRSRSARRTSRHKISVANASDERITTPVSRGGHRTSGSPSSRQRATGVRVGELGVIE